MRDDRLFPLDDIPEHTEWFRPYVAAYYAHVYLGLDPTREETMERMEEFLALERQA